jgi:hypothetical protein
VAFFRLAGLTLPLSAFLNNTPIVAMLMPVVIDWCRRNSVSPSKLLIPLSFLTILGGTCTLIGTSTNLVVSGLMEKSVMGRGLGLFELAVIGVPYAIIGVGDSMYPQYNSRIVYDSNMCVEVLQIRNGMTREEADEFMEYNVTGAYVGPSGRPIFLHRDSGLVAIKPAKKSKVKRPSSTDQLELPLVIEVL